jgi:hypothetical protein
MITVSKHGGAKMLVYEIKEFNPVDGYFNLIYVNGTILAKTFSKADAERIIEAMVNLEGGINGRTIRP